MHALFFSDPHWSSLPRDYYRFDLFPFIANLVRKYKIPYVICGGDYTVDKDRHNSYLVNKIVGGFTQITKAGAECILNTGNHDYIDESEPYFAFLGKLPRITFVTEPMMIELKDKSNIIVIPHSRKTPDWAELPLDEADVVLLHTTFNGALGANGMPLQGSSVEPFSTLPKTVRVLSGDVHVPQTLGRVTYIGSPYHVAFGDAFQARMIYLNKQGKAVNIDFPTVSKPLIEANTISSFKTQLDTLKPKDQVKVRMHLFQSELVSWPTMKKEIAEWCDKADVELHSIELKQKEKQRNRGTTKEPHIKFVDNVTYYEKYVSKEKIADNISRVGREFL